MLNINWENYQKPSKCIRCTVTKYRHGRARAMHTGFWTRVPPRKLDWSCLHGWKVTVYNCLLLPLSFKLVISKTCVRVLFCFVYPIYFSFCLAFSCALFKKSLRSVNCDSLPCSCRCKCRWSDSCDVAHGNAIPSESDVYRQTFLFLSSQPLIPQKYHWYYRNHNKKEINSVKIISIKWI